MIPHKSFIVVFFSSMSFLQLSCEKNKCIDPVPSSSKPVTVVPNDQISTKKTSITTITAKVSGTTKRLNDVYFVNSSIGFISGNDGTILKTTDGGNTWQPLNSGVIQHLYRINFVDENIGYAIGDRETILKTVNGGSTWVRQHYNPSTYNPQNLRYLFVFDANNVYTGGHWGGFFTTNNGGTTWNDKNIDNSTTGYCIYFEDLNKGFVAGNFTRIRHTTNGGTSWTVSDPMAIHTTMYTPYDAIVDLHFFNHQNGIILAENGITHESYLLRTSTGGEPWTIFYTPPFLDANLYDLNFSSDSIGLLIARSDDAYTDKGKILKTTDGGNSWTQFPESYDNLNKIFMFNDTTAIMVGNSGTILKGE